MQCNICSEGLDGRSCKKRIKAHKHCLEELGIENARCSWEAGEHTKKILRKIEQGYSAEEAIEKEYGFDD